MTRACNNVFKFEQLADETQSPFFNDDGKLLAAIQALTIYSILRSGEEDRYPTMSVAVLLVLFVGNLQ